MTATVAVVTVVSGRHAHLRAQRRGLAASTVAAIHVVVAMDDPGVGDVVAEVDVPTVVVDCPRDPDGRLPLARARNLGAEAATTAGVALTVFLDVDCITGPDTLRRYVEACATDRTRSTAAL